MRGGKDYISEMRPHVGSSMINIPITFDYKGGRKESQRTRYIWSVFISILGLLISISAMFSSEGSVIYNMAISCLILCGTMFIVRFLLLKEGTLRREYLTEKKEDYKLEETELWGIYEIEKSYPYYCRFRDGKSGIFVRLNKDVVLGKYSESEFQHYEAIGDALKMVGESNIRICHIDYMDNVGTDERLDECFRNLNSVENPDIRDILTDIFSYQKKQMLERVSTFDVYLFMWQDGIDITAWYSIRRILGCLLGANYRSYHVLDRYDLRDLAKVVFNLDSFSVIGAVKKAVTANAYDGVIPIKTVDIYGNEVKINPTISEKRALEKQQEELKNRKSTKTNKKDDEEMKDIWG